MGVSVCVKSVSCESIVNVKFGSSVLIFYLFFIIIIIFLKRSCSLFLLMSMCRLLCVNVDCNLQVCHYLPFLI